MVARFYQGADLLLPSSFFFSSPSPTSRSQWALPDVIASSRSQWVLPDLNRETRSAVDTAGPQLRAPYPSQIGCQIECQMMCQIECQKIYQVEYVEWQNICQNKCQIECRIECEIEFQIEWQNIYLYIHIYIYVLICIYIYMSYHNISFQMTIPKCQNLCLGVGITRSKVVFFRSAAWSRLRSKTAFNVLNIVHLIFVAHAWRAWIPSIHQVPWSGASFYWFLAIDSHGQPGSRHAQTSINRFTSISKQII